MTVRDFNKIRWAPFDAAMKIDDVAECVAASGECTIYEVLDENDKHGYIACAYETQMNDNTLAKKGYKLGTMTIARRVMHVNGQTKCATFLNPPIL